MRANSRLKCWIAGAVVVGSAAYLIASTLSSYAIAERSIQDLNALQHRTDVKLSGHVVAGSVRYDAEQRLLRFAIADAENARLAVSFQGLRPDAFREGGQVMVEGQFDPQTKTLAATSLLAKCPSRYEAAATQGQTPLHPVPPPPQ